MGTIDLRAAEIAKTVLTTENDDLITQMFKLAQKENNRPCQFSDAEIIEQIQASKKDVRLGKVISLEEIEKKYR